MDEYLLNRLKITKDEREIGMLINTQNLSELWLEHEHKYHVGNDILPTLSPNDPDFQSWYENNKMNLLRKRPGIEPADD